MKFHKSPAVKHGVLGGGDGSGGNEPRRIYRHWKLLAHRAFCALSRTNILSLNAPTSQTLSRKYLHNFTFQASSGGYTSSWQASPNPVGA